LSLISYRKTVRGSVVGIREDLNECLAIAGDSKVVCAVSERKPEEINEIFEEKVIEDGLLSDLVSTDSTESKCTLQLLRDPIQTDETECARMVKKCRGVPEETTTEVHRLEEMAKKGELLSLTINESDYATKLKFGDVYGCWHSLSDDVMRAMDVMIGGKRALVCDYNNAGKGFAFAMRGAGVCVLNTEIGPIRALQAVLEITIQVTQKFFTQHLCTFGVRCKRRRTSPRTATACRVRMDTRRRSMS